MKKQVSKMGLKTDKIVGLSKNKAAEIVGGRPKPTISRQSCYLCID